MKKFYLPFIAAAALLAAASCNKDAGQAEPVPSTDEIVLLVGDTFDPVVDTKTTAVSAVPSSLYWGASTGSAGSETSKWASASASVSSNKISTGKYQTATPTSYNYYVANQSFTIGSSTTMTASSSTDVVCGRAASNSTTPSVTLNHIFARTGSFTATATDGYSISSVSWQIIGKSEINGTAGTYNLTTDTWTAASTKLSSYTAITSSSDMYLIPGTYTIKVSYTLSKGDWSASYTKTGDVTIVKGKVNNISASFSGSATAIVLSVSLTDWGTQNHTPTFS